MKDYFTAGELLLALGTAKTICFEAMLNMRGTRGHGGARLENRPLKSKDLNTLLDFTSLAARDKHLLFMSFSLLTCKMTPSAFNTYHNTYAVLYTHGMTCKA